MYMQHACLVLRTGFFACGKVEKQSDCKRLTCVLQYLITGEWRMESQGHLISLLQPSNTIEISNYLLPLLPFQPVQTCGWAGSAISGGCSLWLLPTSLRDGGAQAPVIGEAASGLCADSKAAGSSPEAVGSTRLHCHFQGMSVIQLRTPILKTIFNPPIKTPQN